MIKKGETVTAIEIVPKEKHCRRNIARLVDYIADEMDNPGRIGTTIIANCRGEDDSHLAALDMIAVQAQAGPNVASDKSKHLVVSFPPGECPKPETIAYIEKRFAETLGYSEHQRVSIVHRDTDCVHLHMAINKIHPDRHTIREPYYGQKKMQRLCLDLELELGLARTNHQAGAGKTRNTAAVERMERMSGEESLAGWIRRECLEQIKTAATWTELQQILAQSGLKLKQKGNGIVIQDERGNAVKGSTVDRELSKNALEKRYGNFIPPEPEFSGTPQKSYRKRPLPGHHHGLYEEYSRERKTRGERRDLQITAIRAERDQAIRLARLQYKADRLKANLEIGRPRKRARQEAARTVYKARVKIARGLANNHIKEEYKSYQKKAWFLWLQEQAEKGRPEAITALQERTAARLSQPRESGRKIAKVTKHGTILYQANFNNLNGRDGTSGREPEAGRENVAAGRSHPATQIRPEGIERD